MKVNTAQRCWSEIGLSASARILRDGAPVLFIHGLGGSSAIFYDAFRYLAGFSVIIPDLPGFGFSPRLSSYSMPRCIELLSSVIRRLHISRFHIVGHSLGADLAIQWAATDTRIDAIVAVEPTFLSIGLALPKAALLASADGKFEAWFQDLRPKDFVHSSKVQQEIAWALASCDPIAFLHLSKEIVVLANRSGGVRTQIYSQFASLKQRKLAILGNDSDGVYLDFLCEDVLKDVVLFKCGHWPMLEDARSFHTTIERFIGGALD